MILTINKYHPGRYVPGEVVRVDVTFDTEGIDIVSAMFGLYTLYPADALHDYTYISVEPASLTQKTAASTISGTLSFVIRNDNITKAMSGEELYVDIISYSDGEMEYGEYNINGSGAAVLTLEANLPNATYYVPSVLFNVKRKSIGIGCYARPYPRIIRFNNGIKKTGFYPVGSIYCSIYEINPTYYFGGTWELYCPGRTLVGVDEDDADFSSVANDWAQGTREEILTTDTIPSHDHDWNSSSRGDGGSDYPRMRAYGYVSTTGYYTSYVGTGQPHNNLQPYITCYIWVKTG